MALPQEEHYTYADLLSWEDDARYELIEGEPVMMVPGPSTAHQDILHRINVHYGNPNI